MPNVQLAMQKHLLNHIQLQAEEQADQQFAQQNPNVALQDPATNMQYQAMLAQFVAQGTQQLVELGKQIQGGGQDQMKDTKIISLH